MAKLKVQAFKPSGKFYTEETYTLEDYPSGWRVNDNMTVKELRNKQTTYCYELLRNITEDSKYCPVNDWSGFTFIFDGIFENSECGFLTRMIKC